LKTRILFSYDLVSKMDFHRSHGITLLLTKLTINNFANDVSRMKPVFKLISVIVLGLALFLVASWWEGSLSKSEGEFIKLGDVTFRTSLLQDK